jgi:hypothetical protein
VSTPIKVSDVTIRDFRGRLFLAGLKDEYRERGPASGLLAVHNGMPVSAVVDCLVRNRPEMFSAKRGTKRQRAVAR